MKKNILEIYLDIYQMSVIVAWDMPVSELLAFARKRKCEISLEEEKEIVDWANGKKIAGVCFDLGKDNVDVGILIKKRPTVSSEFGVLYHELYHAVDHIANHHNLTTEKEARAHIFEYLANQCNKFFWNKPDKKKKKR